MSVEQKIKSIEGGKHSGSSTSDARIYHDLPFERYKSFRRHRGGTLQRINNLKDITDLKDKTILDIGCNVGGISFGAAELAKKVTGMDHDPESIAVANEVKKEMGIENVEFVTKEITIETIRELPGFDLIIWLSQWMWSVKQRGIEYAKDLIFEVSKKAGLMIFESAAGDGTAGIKGATQDDIEKWLKECSCYNVFRRLPSTGGWRARDIFFCIKPWHFIDERRVAGRSTIERVGRDRIKKTFRAQPDFLWMKDREVQALERLKNYTHYPRVLGIGPDYYVMTYVGRFRDVRKNMMDQAVQMSEELKKAGITHRDISRRNILALSGVLYLIDFGWSLFDGEKNIPVELSGKSIAERGLTDEQALKKSLDF